MSETSQSESSESPENKSYVQLVIGYGTIPEASVTVTSQKDFFPTELEYSEYDLQEEDDLPIYSLYPNGNYVVRTATLESHMAHVEKFQKMMQDEGLVDDSVTLTVNEYTIQKIGTDTNEGPHEILETAEMPN